MARPARSPLPRWAVPAMGFALILSSLYSQIEATLASSACLEQKRTEAIECALPPEPWSIAVSVFVLLAIVVLVVRSRSDTRTP